MKNVYFTSDLHFGHTNVLYFHPERRDEIGITLEFLQEHKNAATRKMDEWIISKWNNTIHHGDDVYILGDFSLGNKEYTEKILRRLNGKKYLIRGNHDKSCKGLEKYFEWVGDIKEVVFSNSQFKFINPDETFGLELCHYPLLGWNRRMHGTSMIHGHTHGSIDAINDSSNELRIDVGFDSAFGFHNFVDLETLYKKMKSISTIDGQEVSFKEYMINKTEKDGIRI